MSGYIGIDLPKPLKGKENIALAQAMKAGDEEAKEKLINGNLRLIVYIAQRYENTGIGIEDLFSIGVIGLIKGANSFDVEKNIQFATYASRCIENEILMFLRKQRKAPQNPISLDEPLSVDNEGNELTLSDVVKDNSISDPSDFMNNEYLQQAMLKLKPKYRKIIEYRFMKEMTQKEVAVALNMTQSYVSRIEKRAINIMKDIVNGKGFKPTSIEEHKKQRKQEEKLKPKGEDSMPRVNSGAGNRPKTIELLKTTCMTYKEINEITGVPLGTISVMALEHRPEAVRRAMASRQPERRAELLAAAGFPQGISNVPSKVEVEVKHSASPSFVERHVAPKEEIKMTEPSQAEQTSTKTGVIKREVSFTYSASGEEIDSKVFVDEMESIIQTIKEGGNRTVTFSMVLQAK